MSSPFPQIRYEGNVQEAKRHTRRGMKELFRTEMIKERAQVPILKRTIEVDDYTTITVQIAREQTFVYIESRSIPEGVVPTLPEEREFDVAQCPPGFIVRKLSTNERQATDTLNQAKYSPKVGGTFTGYPGHIIAYDGKRWRIAQYDELNLGPFENAYGCGWWHLNSQAKKLTGRYNKCDLLTWNGGPGGLNCTGWFRNYTATSGEDAVGPKVFFGSTFYLAGKEYTAPCECVFGACILNSGGVDYFYVIGCNTTTVNLIPYVNGKTYSIYKAPVSSPNDWSLVRTLHALIDNDSPYVRAADDPLLVGSNLYLPWGSAYIDEEGNAYVEQDYWARYAPPVGMPLSSRLKRLIKVDLRSGAWETIADTSTGLQHMENSRRYDISGDKNYAVAPSQPEAKQYNLSANNISRTWMDGPLYVGMHGGADKLYTYFIEPYEAIDSLSSQVSGGLGPIYGVPTQNPPPDLAYYYQRPWNATQTRNAKWTMRLVVYEDGIEVDSLALEETDIQYLATHSYTAATHEEKRVVASSAFEGTALGSRTTRFVFSHNPQIKDSWEYSEYHLSWDAIQVSAQKTFRYYRDNKIVHERSLTGGGAVEWSTEITAGMVPGYTPSDEAGGGYFGAYAGYLRAGYPNTAIGKPWVLKEVPWDIAPPSPESKGVTYTDVDRRWPIEQGHAQYHSFKAALNSPSLPVLDGGGWGNHYTYISNMAGAKPYWYGDSNANWGIAADSHVGDGSNRHMYRPCTEAVHRYIADLKARPYIRMRRKIYRHGASLSEYYDPLGDNTTSYGNIYSHGAWDQIFLSNVDPHTEQGAPNTMWQDWEFADATSRKAVHWWHKPLGNAKYGYNWDEWEIDCNFMTKEKINILVKYDPLVDKGAENMFFEIAVL